MRWQTYIYVFVDRLSLPTKLAVGPRPSAKRFMNVKGQLRMRVDVDISVVRCSKAKAGSVTGSLVWWRAKEDRGLEILFVAWVAVCLYSTSSVRS